MTKNIITERLNLIEKLLQEVNYKEEFLFLLGEREALLPFRYLFNFIQLKGGNKQIESYFFDNKKGCRLQNLHQRKLALHKQEISDRSSKKSETRMCIPAYPGFREIKPRSGRSLQHRLDELTPEQEDFIIESGMEDLLFRRHSDAFSFFKSLPKFAVSK